MNNPYSASCTGGSHHYQDREHSELTSTATPFIPTSQIGATHSESESCGGDEAAQLVPITRGGCIYFVSEGEAPIKGEENVSEAILNADGSEWTLMNDSNGDAAASIPARPVESLLAHENIRRIFDRQNEWLMQQLDPSDERYKEIPMGFHCMYPLDPPVAKNSHRDAAGSWGYPTHMYKVTSQTDGRTYALRRVENVRTNDEIASSAENLWRRIDHPNVLTLHRSFVSHGALFFLTDYIPGAQSLKSRYLDTIPSIPEQNVERCSPGSPSSSVSCPEMSSNLRRSMVPLPRSILVSESLIWSYICQLVSALYAIHTAGMACRSIDAAHILLAGQNRIRINGVGIIDVLEYDTKKSAAELQREDIFALGRLILSLANRCTATSATVAMSMEFLQQNYSPELYSFVTVLISRGAGNIRDIGTMISSHIMYNLQHQYGMADAYERELSKEYQNGRLLMLLVKFGLINERPEFNADPSWSETGDRYLLKLYRDYVFHQVDDHGHPIVDFGHIIHSLNQLDIGSTEEILLSSRDGNSILVASFAEIKSCMEKAFSELMLGASGPGHS